MPPPDNGGEKLGRIEANVEHLVVGFNRMETKIEKFGTALTKTNVKVHDLENNQKWVKYLWGGLVALVLWVLGNGVLEHLQQGG